MRSTTIYTTNSITGEVERTEIERKTYAPSYDADVAVPLHQRILNAYRTLECEGKLRPTDIEHSKAYTRDVHKNALAHEQR